MQQEENYKISLTELSLKGKAKLHKCHNYLCQSFSTCTIVKKELEYIAMLKKIECKIKKYEANNNLMFKKYLVVIYI